ncbi:universal stress protein [Pukyongia salina]|uniref:Universal stress protein n=1 Tax=Pukyongia salina TaxID=2094025 RepID=A0A2S0HSS6_9FLAO|nr:universal stress protein [Pukyongia salina]AVI49692.1 universal stress protein [Pukyongia salina]
MKKILLPTDFSTNSVHAINFALNFFKGEEVHFVFLNIQKSSEYITDDLLTASPNSSVHEAISSDNTENLKALEAKYRDKFQDEKFTFETIFDFDVFIDAIAQIVSAKNIDLIVMGTNGASSAKEVIFGSNTLQVIRHIACPVLAIPEDFEYNTSEKVLLSIDNNEIPSRAALAPLLQLIETHDFEIHVLSIYESGCTKTEENELQKKLADRLSGLSPIFHTMENIPVPSAIESFTQLTQTDMHAVFIKEQSFLERLIGGPDKSKLSYRTNIPLLVLKA